MKLPRRPAGARALAGIWLGCWLLMLSFAAPPPARAQTVSHEYSLKAVFLLNFARFTDWPTNAFPQADSPFVIGIVGENPFGSLVDDTVRDEQVNNRPFVVKYFRHPGDLQDCDMLFICQSESGHLRKILAELKGKPVLTVADSPNAAEKGVCVQFVIQDNKLHLRINLSSLKAANLTMSSELLRLSDVVTVSTQ